MKSLHLCLFVLLFHSNIYNIHIIYNIYIFYLTLSFPVFIFCHNNKNSFVSLKKMNSGNLKAGHIHFLDSSYACTIKISKTFKTASLV